MSQRKEQRLRERIKRLEAENAFLRSKASTTTDESVLPRHKGGYFSYLLKNAKGHALYRLIERLTKYFSRFRLISHIFRFTGLVMIAVETSAVLFVIVAAAAVLLPLAALIFPVLFLCSALLFKRDSRTLDAEIKESKAIVWFIPRQYRTSDNSFFLRNAQELSERGYTVIAVTPFILSPIGITSSRRYFLNIRREGKGLFVIRQQYFFYIKSRLLKSRNSIFIY